MALADKKVGRIVGWGNLKNTCAKFQIHVFIPDDWDATLGFGKFWGEGTDGKLANEGRVARVLRIDGDGSVTGDCLWSSGRNGKESN